MLKDIKIKPDWQNKTLTEWLRMFPKNTPISIHSYGVWCISLGSISIISLIRLHKVLWKYTL